MALHRFVGDPGQFYDDPRLDAEYRTWAKCTGSLISRHRLDGTFRYVSPASRAILGWEPEEIVGRKLGTILHPDDAAMVVSELGRTPASPRPVTMTFRLLRKDGTYVWVEATAGVVESDTEGNGPEIITILRDVSDRTNIENQVRRAQEILPALFDNLPLWIVLMDKEGRLQYANRHCETAMGWSASELQDHDLWADAGPDPEVLDVRILTKHGHYVVIRWAGVRLADGGGIGIGIDITERLAHEAALREADRRKDEFLATLAHELRNPLAPIANAAEALLRKDTSDPDIVRARALICEKTKHLIRLVDDLLDVARVSNGVIQLDKQDCEIGVLLRQVITTSEPLLQQAGHRFTFEIDATPIRLRGDSVRLVQAFVNLLNNAAKFTPAGGAIGLSVTRVDGQVVIRLRDNGKGIAAENLPRIFDLFFQAHRPHGAMGIGLALARSVVELHGGNIEARSDGPGLGSEFIVRLPVAPSEAEQGKAFEHASRGVVPPPRRILIVDDDPAVADGLAMLLESMGQQVHVAHDGAAAVEVASQFDPALVFIDLSMPLMDGYETARRMRTLPGAQNRRLIALTGYGLASVETRVQEAGFDDYLAKPAEPVDLERILR